MCVCIYSFLFFSFWHVYPPLFLFLFLFLEFINGLCGLRWMCCGGSVAYYVECTNVVKKWVGSVCVNRGYQGRQGWFWNSDVKTLLLSCFVTWLQLCSHIFEREEETADFRNIIRRGRTPPSLRCSRLAIEKIGDWKKLEILVQNHSFWNIARTTASTSQQRER